MLGESNSVQLQGVLTNNSFFQFWQIPLSYRELALFAKVGHFILSSSLVLKVLKDAYNAGRNFRVVVVDSRPKFEGEVCSSNNLWPCVYFTNFLYNRLFSGKSSPDCLGRIMY